MNEVVHSHCQQFKHLETKYHLRSLHLVLNSNKRNSECA